MRLCSIKDCDKPHLARGMCAMHYRRASLYGDPTKVTRKQFHGLSLAERLDVYTAKSAGCWEWAGYRDPNGYGRLNIGNRPYLAHRLSYALNVREIGGKEYVLHRCDNPGCVNPDHLFIGTQADNVADMWSKGRQAPGHVFGENHGCSKLTEPQVLEIRASASTPNTLSAQYGVGRRTIRDIQARRSWRHIA